MKEIREYYDKTQQELADILSVSRSTYAGWENGIDSIPLFKLNDFCNYFNISLDYICNLTNTKSNNNINDKVDKIIIGEKLKEIRTKANDTQYSTAKSIGIHQSNYSRYESGKIMITTYQIIEFAKYYKVSIDYLCGKSKKSEI